MNGESRMQLNNIRRTMSAYSWLLSIAFISFCFDGVQPLEGSRNVEDDAQKPINTISLGGGWGLPDRVAIVGKIFHYQLPKHDTSCGNLTNYEVTTVENGDGNLPDWLIFSRDTSSVEGVPGPDAIGQIHSVQVTAYCIGSANGSSIPIKEFFTIRVSAEDEQPNEFNFKPLKQTTSADDVMFVRCDSKGSVTTATVTIDADNGFLSAVERVLLLRQLSSHLGLPESLVRLAPFQERPVFDDSALVAGPGDTKHPTHPGLLIQWNVGCGNVFAEHMPVLELLEVTSNNGTMGKAIGHGVVGWHITSKRLNQRRLKRRISFFSNPTATPMLSVIRPTGRPGPTATVTDTEDGPGTRIIPTTKSSMAVPELTRSQPPVTPPWAKETSKSEPPRPTKSPAPTTTYVTITPTRVLTSTALSTAESTVSVTKSTTPSFPVDVIEPSSDLLPTWTTDASRVAPRVTPSMTSSRLPSSKPTKRTPRTQRPSTTARSTLPFNRPPVVAKPLEPLKALVGNMLLFQIPDDTFSDDGGVESLRLLFLHDSNTVEPSSWINLNETSRTLYGLPSEEHIGMHHYELAAVDEDGRLVKTPCNVSVQPHPPSHKLNNEFSVTLDLEYEKVMYDLETRMNLINKIAAAFGDRDASKLTITGISPGSVVITWTNNTLPLEPCPQKEIEALLRYLLQPDGQINETFEKAMEPYRVLKAEGKYVGSCAFLTNSTTTSAVPVVATHPEMVKTTTTMMNEVDVKPRLQKSDNLLLYILLPLLLFFLLLLFLIIICVVCYKKQRRRRKEEDKLTGLHKGIPIIFADELEEKPDTPASTLRSRGPDSDDKRSVPPPEYPTSKPGSRSSTLRSDYKSPLISDNEDDIDAASASPPETLPRKTGRAQEQTASTTTPLLHFKG